MALTNAQRQKRYRVRKRNREQSCAVDAVVALLEQMPRVRATETGPYTYADRARDFLAVFGGTSTPEQGRCVLSQIHQICDPAPARANADKPGTLAFNEGMRRVMSELMLCMVAKPPVTIERIPDDDKRFRSRG